MAHHNTIFAQLLKFVSRHEFEGLAKQHHCGQKLRATNRWSQLVCLCLGQLSGRHNAPGKAAMKLHVSLDHHGHLPSFTV